MEKTDYEYALTLLTDGTRARYKALQYTEGASSAIPRQLHRADPNYVLTFSVDSAKARIEIRKDNPDATWNKQYYLVHFDDAGEPCFVRNNQEFKADECVLDFMSYFVRCDSAEHRVRIDA